MENLYRTKIYDQYVSSQVGTPAPRSLDDFKPRAPYLSRVVRRHLPPDPDATILDLGCGHGALVYFARRAGYRNVSGIDASPEQVAEARRLGIVGIAQGDVFETLRSLPDASHDVIVTFDLIEHLGKDELLHLAEEVRRTLKRGGRWIIHTPNAGSPFFGMVRYGDYTHEQAFTPSSINQVLSVSGFGRVECFEDDPIPHGIKSAIRWLLWKFIRSGLRLYVAAEMGDARGDLIFSQCFLVVALR